MSCIGSCVAGTERELAPRSRNLGERLIGHARFQKEWGTFWRRTALEGDPTKAVGNYKWGILKPPGTRTEWPCAECGAPAKLSDHQPERQWRHLGTCQYRTVVDARPPLADCGEHEGARKAAWTDAGGR